MQLSLRLLRLMVGLFVFATGLVITINGGLGMSSWNCLNSGIIQHIPISFGQCNIAVGIILVTISAFAKQNIGLGTLGNMLFVGIFMDLLQNNQIIPTTDNLWIGLCMTVVGMCVSALGTYGYLGAGFGAGPRDGVMLAIMKWTGKPLATCRIAIECTVLTVAILLGGFYGIGTIMTTFGNGPIMQTIFKFLHFNTKEVKHQYLNDLFKQRSNH